MSSPAGRASNAARAHRATFATGSAPPDAVLVSLYRLDNGSAADDQAVVNGAVVGTWGATNTGSLAVGIGGTSMYKAGGTPHITLPANNAAHNLTRLSLSFYYQPQFNNNKHVLFACAPTGATAAGDLAIERLTNGRLRAWHVGQDGGLRFFESTDGVAATNLVTGTAYRITATFGLGGAKLYLNNTLVASITQNTNGWNNTRVKYIGVWADGTTDPAQGLFDHVRIWNGELQASGVTALEAAQSVTPPSTGEFITTPEAHGWDAGNTDLQNTGFLQDAIDFANANAGSSGTGRGVVELVQGKLYTVDVSANGTGTTPTSAILAKSNVEIRTAGQPTRASGNQATIKWASWSGKTGLCFRVLAHIEGISNFHLGYVTLDGNKNSINNVLTNINYSLGQNGGLHGVRMKGTNSSVTFKELTVTHCLGDGLLATLDTISNILAEDCTFTRNRRQGMSYVKSGTLAGGYDQAIFRRCIFRDTGDFPGDVLGNQPAAGVDVEPDNTSNAVYGLTFDGCEFRNNYGSSSNNGTSGLGSQGVGLKIDCQATLDFFKVTDCLFTENTHGSANGIGVSFAVRGNPVYNRMLIENNVSSGNDVNHIQFTGETGGNGGTLTNTTLTNNNVTAITFTAGLNDTGHSVTIWRGNFNPTVTTNGATTITNNAGFPP